MHANFWEDRLRGFGVAKGRILAFSIDLHRRLKNTLELPCERVINGIRCLQRLVIVIRGPEKSCNDFL